MMRALSLASVVFIVAACDANDEPTQACPASNGTLPDNIYFTQDIATNTAASDPTVVRGTFTPVAGMTVFKILVADIAATDDGNNYAAFDATIPLATLRSLAAGGTAKLPAIAVTNCGTTKPFPFTVPLTTTSTLLINGAQQLTAIPANGAKSDVFTVTADKSDVGASVTLTTSLGLLDGSASETLTLIDAGSGSASGTASLSGNTHAGDAVITARTPTAAASPVHAMFFGPPTIVPASLVLTANETVTVTASDSSDSNYVCASVPIPGVSIADTGHTSTTNDVLTLTVTTPVGGATTTITCTDEYGQSTVGTYTVSK